MIAVTTVGITGVREFHLENGPLERTGEAECASCYAATRGATATSLRRVSDSGKGCRRVLPIDLPGTHVDG